MQAKLYARRANRFQAANQWHASLVRYFRTLSNTMTRSPTKLGPPVPRADKNAPPCEPKGYPIAVGFDEAHCVPRYKD